MGRTETLVNIRGRSNGQIKTYGTVAPLLWFDLAQPDLRVQRLAIPHLLHVKRCTETLVNIRGRYNGQIKSYGTVKSVLLSDFARPNLRVTY